MLLNTLPISLVVASFFALMISNIYVFFLYTLSRAFYDINRSRLGQVISVLLRLAFVAFLAVVVAKPIEALIYTATLDKSIASHRRQIATDFETVTEVSLRQETTRLSTLLKNSNADQSIKKRADLETLLSQKQEKAEASIRSMRELVYGSSYFVERVKILLRDHPSSWYVTGIVLMLFLMPAFGKLELKEDSSFYNIKNNIALRLVKQDHRSFKQLYSELFVERASTVVDYHEHYVDPPLNTIRKPEKRSELLRQEVLIKELYDA